MISVVCPAMGVCVVVLVYSGQVLVRVATILPYRIVLVPKLPLSVSWSQGQGQSPARWFVIGIGGCSLQGVHHRQCRFVRMGSCVIGHNHLRSGVGGSFCRRAFLVWSSVG